MFKRAAAAAAADSTTDNIKGIPDFWLTILRNTSLISEMIQPHDEPILSHLTDIKVYLLQEPMVNFSGSLNSNLISKLLLNLCDFLIGFCFGVSFLSK